MANIRVILNSLVLIFMMFGSLFADEETCDASEEECGNPSFLLSEETREQLATKLNKIIDVPLLNEDHEQVLAEKLIEKCLSAFGEDSEDFNDMKKEIKEKLVQKLNSAINVPFASEKLEARALGKIVDFILKDSFTHDADMDDDEEEEAVEE